MAIAPASYWIEHLQLNSHVEGGWYAEAYRSSLSFTEEQLPAAFKGSRAACTHIYFLLEKEQYSAFHRIQSDELWHFYQGEPLSIYEIDTSGVLTEHRLGNDPQQGHSLFCMIKAGSWFASRVVKGSNYALVGCTVAPGFDFADFELAKEEALLKQYPQHQHIIKGLCR